MASVEELLREAEYAFQNVSPGSADEKKYAASAKRFASRVVRRSPVSNEAARAREILRNLGVAMQSARRPTGTIAHGHRTPESTHSAHAAARSSPTVTFDGRSNSASAEVDSWGNIWQTFLALSQLQKKIGFFIAIFTFLIFTAMPFLFLIVFFYVVKPKRVRKHLYAFLKALG